MNTNSIQAKHLQDDIYHKSEMREFARLRIETQLRAIKWTAITALAAAIIGGTLIGVLPLVSKVMGWIQ